MENWCRSMVQHAWLERQGPKATLLVFVDDATSEILATEFVPESASLAMKPLQTVFQSTWTSSFYSDRFSVFRDNHKGNLAYEPITQFQRALSVLDVKLICASSPQAKGRVERANETLQDR